MHSQCLIDVNTINKRGCFKLKKEHYAKTFFNIVEESLKLGNLHYGDVNITASNNLFLTLKVTEHV